MAVAGEPPLTPASSSCDSRGRDAGVKEGRATAVLVVLDDRRAARQARVPSFTPAPAVRESRVDRAGVRRAGQSRGVASFTAAPAVCDSRALHAAGIGGARADEGAVRSVRCRPRSVPATALTAAEDRCESRRFGAGRGFEARARRGGGIELRPCGGSRLSWSRRAAAPVSAAAAACEIPPVTGSFTVLLESTAGILVDPRTGAHPI